MLAGTVLPREEAVATSRPRLLVPARNRASSPSRFVAPPPRYSPVVTCIPGARYRCARSHESRDGPDDGSVTLELEQPRIARGLGNEGTDALRLPVKRTDIAYRSFGARWLSLETIINEASLKCYKTQVEPFAIISIFQTPATNYSFSAARWSLLDRAYN